MNLLFVDTIPLRVNPKLSVLEAAKSLFEIVIKRVILGKSKRTGEPAAGAIDDVTYGSAED
jgi:hypothetical protein